MGRFWPISSQKKFENFLVIKSAIILHKFGQKLAENRPILGPKKPAGLSGFEDRASGGLGPPKKRHGRAGFGLSPRPDPSLYDGLKIIHPAWLANVHAIIQLQSLSCYLMGLSCISEVKTDLLIFADYFLLPLLL